MKRKTIYSSYLKDDLETIAITLARINEKDAIDLITIKTGYVTPQAEMNLSDQEYEDFKVIYLAHQWEKFFKARKDSLIPKLKGALKRKMNSWKEKYGVDLTTIKVVLLNILGEVMEKSPSEALEIYSKLEQAAREKKNPLTEARRLIKISF